MSVQCAGDDAGDGECRVLVAPDKFKGTLTASEVADCIADGLESRGVVADRLPLADGGDGSVDAALAGGFVPVDVDTTDALGRRTTCTLAFSRERDAVVVEVANAVGIAALNTLEPLRTGTRGFGTAVGEALERRPRQLVMALGGSASTDGGLGLLQALGARIVDATGRELPSCGASLPKVQRVDFTGVAVPERTDLVVACDVTNPLLGPTGTAVVFGPQKGATLLQVNELEDGLCHFVDILARDVGSHIRSLADRPGAGAAGGLGFAALIVGARIVSGADFFLDLLDFDQRLHGCEAVVTGEGCIDAQTLSGKLPFKVAGRAAGRPVHMVVGRDELTSSERDQLNLASIRELSQIAAIDTSYDIDRSRSALRQRGAEIGDIVRSNRHD